MLRPYQEQLVSAVVADIERGIPEVVLAGCPGSGKTIMSIEAIGRLLASGSASRVLVLAHGTRLLRSQYTEALALASPGFSWSVYLHRSAKDHVPFSDLSAQVIIALPQSVLSADHVGEFDLLVVDEAHQFYGKQMVGDIIARIGAPRALLLTGTPSPFIAKGTPIHAVSMQEAFEAGNAHSSGPWISDAEVKLIRSHYEVRYSEYSNDGEIKKSVAFGAQETRRTLDDVGAWISSGEAEDWAARLKRIGKTLLICRSQEIASHAAMYFRSAGAPVHISTSDTDNGAAIDAFKNGELGDVLVVVRRANLGFDFPRLSTVIDMTGSINIDRIFQMFARAVRPSAGVKKTFIKLASAEMFEYTRSILKASLLLAGRSLYLAWNGVDLTGVRVPLPLQRSTDAAEGSRGRGDGRSVPLPEIDDAFFVFADFFRVEIGPDGKPVAGVSLADLSVAMGNVKFFRDPEGRNEELLLYYQVHRRPVPVDHPLHSTQSSRITPGSPMFNPAVLAAARAVGLRKHGDYGRFIGMKFHRLTVLSVGKGERYVMATAACECGKETTTKLANLKSGATKSCGCFARDSGRERMRRTANSPGHKEKTRSARWPGREAVSAISADDEPQDDSWSTPDDGGRQTCTVCSGEGVDRREGGKNACLHCDGDGYRWPDAEARAGTR